MVPINKTIATGQPTPQRLARALAKAGQSSDINDAALVALPPGSKGLGHLVQGGLGTAAITAGLGMKTAAATAVTAALYSKAGVAFLTGHMGGLLPAETRAYIATLPPAQAVQYLAGLSQRFPHLAPSFQEAVAQVGRQVAQPQQQQPQEATQ